MNDTVRLLISLTLTLSSTAMAAERDVAVEAIPVEADQESVAAVYKKLEHSRIEEFL